MGKKLEIAGTIAGAVNSVFMVGVGFGFGSLWGLSRGTGYATEIQNYLLAAPFVVSAPLGALEGIVTMAHIRNKLNKEESDNKFPLSYALAGGAVAGTISAEIITGLPFAVGDYVAKHG